MMAVEHHLDDLEILQRATAFLHYEADLLDRHAFGEWLKLWDESGRYIVPASRDETDFENSLNYIFDDHVMRSQRVARLLGGQAPSATPLMRSVRTVSRVRLMDFHRDQWVVSSAQLIVTFKRSSQTLIAADVTHKLNISPDGIRMVEKVVRLINADEPLPELSFLP